jgi:hypothetical protein
MFQLLYVAIVFTFSGEELLLIYHHSKGAVISGVIFKCLGLLMLGISCGCLQEKIDNLRERKNEREKNDD